MSLTPGSRLGPYEVVSSLGAGGMGEVYRATDTKLGRQVALKVLPESFLHDPERVARFQREARTLASLNHPHIGGIHGLEDADGVTALVLELVEGPTLADRIAQGPLPIDEALAIAKQIAEALEAAHEQSIIHRDLKPANIKVRPDGMVKVLDFGLAKALATDPSDPNLSVSPTLSLTGATRMGSVIGTASYMAPEQAKGRPVDRRADVWAFGAVLYEMLAGRRAFVGDDVSETLVSVLRDEPDWSALPADVPSSARQVMRVCLQKDPKKRVRDMSAVRLALDGAFDGPTAPTTSTPPATATPGAQWLRILPWALTTLAVAGLGASIVLGRPQTSAPRVEHFVITTPADAPVQPTSRSTAVELSPDGSRIVYRTTRGQTDGPAAGVLYIRELTHPEATLVTGSENVSGMFFSPDGQWIGFSENNVGAAASADLKRVSVAGGAAQMICRLDSGLRGASWAADNTIVFATAASKGLRRVSASGGEPQVLTTADAAAGIQHVWPEVLPGDKTVLFLEWMGTPERSRLLALSLDTGKITEVLRGVSQARFSSTGHLVYSVDSTLRAVSFDPVSLTTKGVAVLVMSNVAGYSSFGASHYSLSRDGSLVYVSGAARNLGPGPRTLVWVDRSGHEEPIEIQSHAYTYARLSPDGTRVALDARDQQSDIWVEDLSRGTLQRLTNDPGINRSPVWTPDGTRIAYSAVHDGELEQIYWQKADGSEAAERLSVGKIIQGPLAFFQNGKRLLFNTPTGPPFDVGVLHLDGERREEMLLKTSFSEMNAVPSPDGAWLAYESNESGQDEIYVTPFPDVSASKRQVSTRGGTRPLWSKNGDELFYYVEPDTIMSVRVTPGPNLTLGRPAVTVKGAFARATNAGRHYDVSPNGKRFLLLKDVDKTGTSAPPASEIHLVKHWDEELKRIIPVN